MPISRIFQPIPLKSHTSIQLNESASHHVARVLRAKIQDSLIIFNGEGGEYQAVITDIDKKSVTVQLQNFITREVESELELYLAQGISRGEKMDYTIQKAVELGVKKIFPMITERCTVKLNDERAEKRSQHWRSIVVSACEQSGRQHIPDIEHPQPLQKLASIEADWRFVLAPTAKTKLKDHLISKKQRILLLIGPEGGLSEKEIGCLEQHGFLSVNLGPRILRTETAALAAITAFQCYFGDL